MISFRKSLRIALLAGLFAFTSAPTSAAPVAELLHRFGLPSAYPGHSSLILGPDGFYWGTTEGRYEDAGSIYKVRADGSGFQTVYFFREHAPALHGAAPSAGLVNDGKGFLWGTTAKGGASSVSVEASAIYTDAGATTTDAEDGTLTPTILSSHVLARVPGTYAVTWAATDSHGATATVTRIVTVVDTNPPVFVPHPDVIAEAKSPAGAIADFGVNATDTAEVTSLTYSPDDRTVTATARDSAGNTATTTFTVTVRNTTASTASGIFSRLTLLPGTPLPDYTALIGDAVDACCISRCREVIVFAGSG